jgi:hypothetical protein
MKHQSKIITFCLIGCIAGLLLTENLYAQNRGDRRKSAADGNFYRVVVENNLFRPLGWRKPKESPQYALIGTKIQPKGEITKAFVKENRSNQYYWVSVGEKVGDATVEKIEKGQINLNIAGKVTTIRADSGPFLSKSGGGRSRGPGQATSQPQNNENKPSQTRQNNRPDPNQIRERFRNVSPEERKKMIEEFQRNRGRGRRGGQRRNRSR